MKTNLLLIALSVIFTFVFSSCSGKKTEKVVSSSDVNEQVAENASDKESIKEPRSPFKGINVDAINALADKKELTAKDYDFLLDQTAILAMNTKDMSKEEQKQVMKNISEKEFMALMVMSSLKKAMEKGNLSEKQVERLKKIEAMNPDI